MGNGNRCDVHGTVDAYIQRCTLSLSSYKPSARAQTHAASADSSSSSSGACARPWARATSRCTSSRSHRIAPRRATTSACESWSASPRTGRRWTGRHFTPAPSESNRTRPASGSCSARLARTVCFPGCGAKGSEEYWDRVADTIASAAARLLATEEGCFCCCMIVSMSASALGLGGPDRTRCAGFRVVLYSSGKFSRCSGKGARGVIAADTRLMTPVGTNLPGICWPHILYLLGPRATGGRWGLVTSIWPGTLRPEPRSMSASLQRSTPHSGSPPRS